MDCAIIDGVTLSYRHDGADRAGPTLVFINSLGTDFRIWDPVIAELGGDFPVLLYDKRGHGLSDVGPTPYAMADHAGDLAGLMDRLGIAEAVICGLSVGGQIAQELYHTRPDLVAGLVICGSAAKIGEADFWRQRMSAIEENGIAAIAEGIMERWFTPAFRKPDNPLYLASRNMLLRQPVEGYVATCGAIAGFDRRADCAAIAVPAAVLVGDQDGATPPRAVEEFAAALPDASFEIVEGAGHIPPLEAPQRVAATIKGLVARLTPKEAS